MVVVHESLEHAKMLNSLCFGGQHQIVGRGKNRMERHLRNVTTLRCSSRPLSMAIIESSWRE